MVNEFIAAPPHNTQCDEGHQYTHSARDRGCVFNFSGQDDGLGAGGVGGRANVWEVGMGDYESDGDSEGWKWR